MKNLILSITLLAFTYGLQSQDIIYLHNGDTIAALIVKVGRHIQYQKYEHPMGAVHGLYKTNVVKIAYEKGTIDSFPNPKNKYTTATPFNPQPPSPALLALRTKQKRAKK